MLIFRFSTKQTLLRWNHIDNSFLLAKQKVCELIFSPQWPNLEFVSQTCKLLFGETLTISIQLPPNNILTFPNLIFLSNLTKKQFLCIDGSNNIDFYELWQNTVVTQVTRAGQQGCFPIKDIDTKTQTTIILILAVDHADHFQESAPCSPGRKSSAATCCLCWSWGWSASRFRRQQISSERSFSCVC